MTPPVNPAPQAPRPTPPRPDRTLRDVARRLPGRILGIDAGGSGTRVVMLEAGELTHLPAGPPMNALLTDGFAGHLRDIITAAGATAAGIGVPGLRQHNDATRLAEALTRQSGCPVHVTGDAGTAQARAFPGGPGVVVLAGTGSAAFGRRGAGPRPAGGRRVPRRARGSAHSLR